MINYNTSMNANPKISVVIPVYNEEDSIEPLYKELKSALTGLKKTYEIIFIDDGSTDRTFKILEGFHKKDKNTTVIKFRKNFGQTPAISAGFNNSKGDVIITMDADLQNDPKDIPRLLKEIEKGYDVVSCWRKYRKDSVITKKIPSKISNIIAKKMTGVNINDFGCTLKAYRREAIKDIELYGEMHRYIPALVSWKGFRIGEIAVKHHERKFGETKYNMSRLVRGFLDLISIKFWMKYSTMPLHFFGTIGLLTASIGFVINAYLTFTKIFLNRPLSERPLLILGVFLVTIGVQFITFG